MNDINQKLERKFGPKKIKYDEVFACTTLGDVLSFNDQGICGPGDLRGDYTGGSFRVSGSDVNGINLVIAPVINN